MNILKMSTKLNMTKKQAWSILNPHNYFLSDKRSDGDNFISLVDGPANYFLDFKGYTERIIPSLEDDMVEIDIVEGKDGPMRYSKGRIRLTDHYDGNVNLIVDLTFDQIFGPLGTVMNEILSNKSLNSFSSKINKSAECFDYEYMSYSKETSMAS